MLSRIARGWSRCVVASVAMVAINPVFADADLDAALARWRTAALTGYEYGYHKYCDCHRESPPETTVSVRDGKVIRVRHRPAGTTTDVPAADKNLDYYWTVEGLFQLIGSALERGVSVRASYDATLGFPREIFIDYDSSLIGDELDLRLTAVNPLP